jgi:adenine phosphoribosyltransferase
MSYALVERLRSIIRDVADFPRPGIVFKDITPVLADAALFREATDALAAPFERDGISHVVAIESRGFILGGPVAQHLGAGLVPVRKPGKLPWRTRRVEYALEYGTDALEMHLDGLPPGARALIVDDVLATGGTAAAAGTLAEQVGGTVVGYSFLMGLGFLGGRSRLGGSRVATLIEY